MHLGFGLILKEACKCTFGLQQDKAGGASVKINQIGMPDFDMISKAFKATMMRRLDDSYGFENCVIFLSTSLSL